MDKILKGGSMEKEVVWICISCGQVFQEKPNPHIELGLCRHTACIPINSKEVEIKQGVVVGIHQKPAPRA
jgi:hypothetical protein